jgi:tetratricopeptide (TPR) repeat protein
LESIKRGGLMSQKQKMKITVTNERAEKATQVHSLRSELAYTDEVKEIQKLIELDMENTDLWMKKGLELAKQMHFREAIESYSIGLSYNPFHALSLRHRGHRLLSTYRFQEAVFDFELSSRIDPKNWDTWYHLGLAYYLIGDFERANNAYTRCFEITRHDQDELVAIVDWKWLTLMRLGREEEARKILDYVNTDTESGENHVYKNRVLMYKGEVKPEAVLDYNDKEFADLELATQGYGVAMYYYFNGQQEKTFELFDLILKNDTYWSAFGYLAAFQDKKRLK